MADPKYANLPGIAYDQPDAYETSDLPEADQPEENFEEENECIERLHLSVPDSFLKFKDKYVSGQSVDFSDRLKKVPNRGYDARFGIWELAGQGEKETPLQKYQRLQCEMKELMQEVSDLKGTVKEDTKEQAVAYKSLATNVELTQKQLSDLRLEEMLGADVLASLKDPGTAQIKKLIAHLETCEQKGSKITDTQSKQKATPGAKQDVVTYELHYHPDQIRLLQTSRVAELENRLQKLENIIGTSNESMARLGSNFQSQNLSMAIQNLEGRVTVLDAAQIDGIESRLSSVAQKMDSIAEKVQGQADPEKEKKVTELYELVKKTESISGILPQTVDRLKALETLHREASEFGASLSKLEALQKKLSGDMDGNAKLLQAVEKTFADNVAAIKKNISVLEQRLTAVQKK